MFHFRCIGTRARLCFPPSSERYENNGWICSPSPSHERWPLQQILVAALSSGKALDVRAYLSDLNRATSGCDGFALFEVFQSRLDGYLRDMLQLKQREGWLTQKLQGQIQRPVLRGRSGKVS